MKGETTKGNAVTLCFQHLVSYIVEFQISRFSCFLHSQKLTLEIYNFLFAKAINFATLDVFQKANCKLSY